jgi:hypothetical protein
VSSGRFCQIVEAETLIPAQHLTPGRARALQLGCHDDAEHGREALEPLAKTLLGGWLVPAALPQAI